MRRLQLAVLASTILALPLSSRADEVARGKYLVEDVAHCQECHTPRARDGSFDRSKWLDGGAHAYAPVSGTADWADIAPSLAGLPGGYSEEALVAFLVSGKVPPGRTKPRLPMKEYRLSESDARAIAAYLSSLR